MKELLVLVPGCSGASAVRSASPRLKSRRSDPLWAPRAVPGGITSAGLVLWRYHRPADVMAPKREGSRRASEAGGGKPEASELVSPRMRREARERAREQEHVDRLRAGWESYKKEFGKLPSKGWKVPLSFHSSDCRFPNSPCAPMSA